MVRNITDNDLYKFSMMYAILQKFPNVEVEYKFINRNTETVYPSHFHEKVKSAIDSMAFIRMTHKEEEYLRTIPYFPSWFIDFLSGYKFNPSEVVVTSENGLDITIKGPWYRTVLWEVPILSIVSELFYKETEQIPNIKIMEDNLYEYSNILSSGNIKLAEFGTRRRFSFEVQSIAVKHLSKCKGFVGTSNVYLAMKNDVKPIGTMAHEWIMAHGAIFGYKMANSLALKHWADVYQGDLGIYLPDTYTTDAFLSSFDKKSAKLFDGLRQDSGNPIHFFEKVYEHYTKLSINPKEKTIVFSDALNVKKILDIHNSVNDKMKISFGDGTDITNNVGVKPLNIVIKLSKVKVNDHYVNAIKLSDDIGKHTGDAEQIQICKKLLNL